MVLSQRWQRCQVDTQPGLSHSRGDAAFAQAIGKAARRLGLAVHQPHGRCRREAAIPAQKIFLISVRREAAERMHAGRKPQRLAVNADRRRAIDDRAAQRAGRLEARDDDVALRPFDVVLQMVQHAAAIAHAAAGDDQSAAADLVDALRVLAGA